MTSLLIVDGAVTVVEVQCHVHVMTFIHSWTSSCSETEFVARTRDLKSNSVRFSALMYEGLDGN